MLMQFNEQLFKLQRELSGLEDQILDHFEDVDFDDISYDSYDNSLELLGVEDTFRATQDQLNYLKDAGFFELYLNHRDKWETHYDLKQDNPNGWRVCYPHKREDATDNTIWVEGKIPDSWVDHDPNVTVFEKK